MQSLQFRWMPIFLAAPSMLFAEASAITAVVNSLSGAAQLAPGLVAQVYYASFVQSDLRLGYPGGPRDNPDPRTGNTLRFIVDGKPAVEISVSPIQEKTE